MTYVRNVLAAVLLLAAVGCSKSAPTLTEQGSEIPKPLVNGKTITSDLVGSWTVAGDDGTGIEQYKSDGTFSTNLTANGYQMEMLGNYAIDGTQLTLTYTKIDMTAPKSAPAAELFKLKPMIQQAKGQTARGTLSFKGKDAASLQFGTTSTETLTRH